MTLETFLESHGPLTAVDLLPDARLINVEIGAGELYGVNVDNLPENANTSRIPATLSGTTITTSTGLTFETPDYTMMGA